MLFRHARVGVAQLFGDNRHGNAFHGKDAAVRVAQHVERYGRLDAGVSTCFGQGAALMRFAPRLSIIVRKNQVVALLSCSDVVEKPFAFVGQNDVAGLAAFACAHGEC